MMRKIVHLTACVALALLTVQCHENKKSQTFNGALPKAPEYADTTQWYIADRHAEADVFYIISTETGDYSLDGTTYYHADTYNDSLRGPLYAEMLGVDTLISGRLNYFSPYYRQCSLQSFTNDSILQDRLPVAIDDVRNAFHYYLEHLNNGRPFVLAGFSQGALIMLELMKEMDDKTFNRMIAAYALGTSISEDMLQQNRHIKAAQGASDTGVTICYNSVRDANCAIWGGSHVAINPVNWRTDAEPAMLATEPSPLLPVNEQKKDTMTIRLDTQTGLLLVDGFTATDYVLPLIGKEGCYHSREIWLYRDQLRENIAHRTTLFLQK